MQGPGGRTRSKIRTWPDGDGTDTGSGLVVTGWYGSTPVLRGGSEVGSDNVTCRALDGKV